jgi:hypothetical protein
VRNVFEEEKPKLYQLPDDPYVTDEREEVKVGKTPYLRYDLNDYSIPYTHVRRLLTVMATPTEIFIMDGMKKIAQHPRCYDKGKQIEQESHIAELAQRKKQSRQHRAQDRLSQSAPSSTILLIQAAERGYHLRTITHNLIQLLDSYGAIELEAAIVDALSKDVPHPNAVQISLEKRRGKYQQPPPIALNQFNDQRVRELVIRPHDIKCYDQLQTTKEENENDDNE